MVDDELAELAHLAEDDRVVPVFDLELVVLGVLVDLHAGLVSVVELLVLPLIEIPTVLVDDLVALCLQFVEVAAERLSELESVDLRLEVIKRRSRSSIQDPL